MTRYSLLLGGAFIATALVSGPAKAYDAVTCAISCAPNMCQSDINVAKKCEVACQGLSQFQDRYTACKLASSPKKAVPKSVQQEKKVDTPPPLPPRDPVPSKTPPPLPPRDKAPAVKSVPHAPKSLAPGAHTGQPHTIAPKAPTEARTPVTKPQVVNVHVQKANYHKSEAEMHAILMEHHKQQMQKNPGEADHHRTQMDHHKELLEHHERHYNEHARHHSESHRKLMVRIEKERLYRIEWEIRRLRSEHKKLKKRHLRNHLEKQIQHLEKQREHTIFIIEQNGGHLSEKTHDSKTHNPSHPVAPPADPGKENKDTGQSSGQSESGGLLAEIRKGRKLNKTPSQEEIEAGRAKRPRLEEHHPKSMLDFLKDHPAFKGRREAIAGDQDKKEDGGEWGE